MGDPFGDNGNARESTILLRAGERHEETLEIGRPARWDEGYVVVGVYLYPDPALDGRLYSGALYYWWDGERLVVSGVPPASPAPSGSSPESATEGSGNEEPPQETPD